MKVRNITTLGSMLAALLLTAGTSLAATHVPCTASSQSAESNTWDFSQEAVNLMSTIRAKSEDVATQADKLVISWPLATESWQYQAEKLDRIKQDINEMGKELCRLQAIRSTVPQWEQTGIDKAAQKLVFMAVHATNAIDYLNSTHTGLWKPEFQKFESTLQTEAHELHSMLGNYIQYAKIHNRDQRLGQTLGVKASS